MPLLYRLLKMNEADLSPYQLTKRMISKIVSYCCVKKARYRTLHIVLCYLRGENVGVRVTNTHMITRAGGKLKPETVFGSEKGYRAFMGYGERYFLCLALYTV